MTPAISIKGLKKIYGNKVEALKGVDLTIQEGDFYALLGPNGAGKSTTIGIISGLINKTSGTVQVFDKNIDNDHEGAKSYIGVVPQEFNFSIFEKVLDIVVNQGGYYGIPQQKALVVAEKYLKQLGLWEKRNDQARMLSGGMKRRLMIARALVHEPRILILDEPTAGVDIELRRSMWDFLTTLTKEGITIILTTHYLEEAEQLCNKVAIIDKGTIIQDGLMNELLATMTKETFIFNLKDQIPSNIDIQKKITKYDIVVVDLVTVEASLTTGQTMNDLITAFNKQNIQIISMRNKSNRLEELFIDLIKKDNQS